MADLTEMTDVEYAEAKGFLAGHADAHQWMSEWLREHRDRLVETGDNAMDAEVKVRITVKLELMDELIEDFEHDEDGIT